MNRLKELYYYIIFLNVVVLFVTILGEMQSSKDFLFKVTNNGYTIVSVIIVLIILSKNVEMVTRSTMKKISWTAGPLILLNLIFGIYSYSKYASLLDWQFPSQFILVADNVLNIIGSIAVIMFFRKEASKQEFASP